MSQVYHSNARTNQHIREIIQKSNLTNVELAKNYNLNVKTISKWKDRDFVEDKSSRPHNIKTTLTPLEKELVRVVRTMTWMELDDLTDTIVDIIPNANRSNVYRTLTANNINTVPQEKKAKAKTFKEYEPGYLHIDVTYLPKIEGKKHYLFGENLRSEWGGRRGGVPTWPPKAAEKNQQWPGFELHALLYRY